MTRITTFLAALVASFGAISSGSQASADVWHHLDSQALTISKKVNLLRTEVLHYRHTGEYQHLIADVRTLNQMAARVHNIAHNQGCLIQLDSNVRQLDRTFHHIENLFNRIERDAAHGIGHIHGDINHVRCLLKSIEGSIHHMQSDLASLQRAAVRVDVRRPYYNDSQRHGRSFHSSPNIYGRNFGIDNSGCTLGRSSCGISF